MHRSGICKGAIGIDESSVQAYGQECHLRWFA